MKDDAMLKLCDAMREQFGAGVQFELELRDLIGRYRVAHERRMKDAQAAELLPLGRHVAAERLGVAPSTVYKMLHRHQRNRSTLEPAA